MESDNHLISYKAILGFFKENYTIEPNSVSCKIGKEEANTIYKMLYQKGFVSIDEVLKFFDKHKIITEYNYGPISHTEYVYNLQLGTYEFDYDILKCLTFSDYVTGKESEESKDSQIINEFIEPLAKIVTDTYAEHKDNNINKFRCSVIIDKLRLEEQKNYFGEGVLATELLLYHIYKNHSTKILDFLTIIKNSTEVKTDLLENLYNALRKVDTIFGPHRSAFEDEYKNNIYIFEDIEFNLIKNTCKIGKYTINLLDISNKNFNTTPSCRENINRPIIAIKCLFGVVKYYCNHIKRGSKIHIEMKRDDPTYNSLESYTKTFCLKYHNLGDAGNLNTDNLGRISNLLKILGSRVLAEQKKIGKLMKGSGYKLILILKE